VHERKLRIGENEKQVAEAHRAKKSSRTLKTRKKMKNHQEVMHGERTRIKHQFDELVSTLKVPSPCVLTLLRLLPFSSLEVLFFARVFTLLLNPFGSRLPLVNFFRFDSNSHEAFLQPLTSLYHHISGEHFTRPPYRHFEGHF